MKTTYRPRFSLAWFTFWHHILLLMTSQLPGNCDASTRKKIYNSLNIDFIHVDIHDRSCKKSWSQYHIVQSDSKFMQPWYDYGTQIKHRAYKRRTDRLKSLWRLQMAWCYKGSRPSATTLVTLLQLRTIISTINRITSYTYRVPSINGCTRKVSRPATS